MRLSSMLSLLVVTATLALGGCAAEAEPTDDEAGQPNVAQAPGSEGTDSNSTKVRTFVPVWGLFASASDEEKARLDVKWNKEEHPGIDVTPSPFGAISQQRIGALDPTFNPLNEKELSIEVERGYLPYSGKQKH